MSARHVLSAAIVAVAMAWWAPPAAVRAQSATLAIVGGFLIDGFGGPPLADSVVLIKGDQIVAVGEEGRLAVPDGARVIDANGHTVMPGLIDAHVHLDILGHGDYPTWHDMREAEALVRMAGLTPMEAIVASTRLAAQALGVNTGVIHPGRLADVILVRGNPLDSVLYLQNVERVIKGGIVYEPRALSGTD